LLGVPIANEKSVGPCRKLVFLGLELDSVLMIVRIPLIKVEELRIVIEQVLQRKKITVQSLVGKIASCSQAIKSGRAFLRRLNDALAGVNKSYHRVRISRAMRLDNKHLANIFKII
jgi:hypothetical protein